MIRGRLRKWRSNWSPWRLRQRVAMWREKYDAAWQDHLARCDCHDSWDQCPCTEVGHEPLPPGRSIHECANRCCRWC